MGNRKISTCWRVRRDTSLGSGDKFEVGKEALRLMRNGREF